MSRDSNHMHHINGNMRGQLKDIGLSSTEARRVMTWQTNQRYKKFLRRFYGPVVDEVMNRIVELAKSRNPAKEQIKEEARRLQIIFGPEGYTLTGSAVACCSKRPS